MSTQVFISYNSRNANKVRFVVDRLIAAGIKVWFAEYEVLSCNYDDFEHEIDDALQEAIRSSTHAIVFSSKGWRESHFCQAEWTGLVRRFGSNAVVQVEIDQAPSDDPVAKALGRAPIIYSDSEAIAVADAIVSKLFPGGTESLPSQVLPSGPYGAGQFVFRYGQILVPEGLGLRRPNPRLGPVGREHEYRFSGSIRGVPAGFEISVNPFDPFKSKGKVYPIEDFGQEVISNDRKAYKLLRHHATEWTSTDDAHEHGLHLYRHGGRGHIGLTFWRKGLYEDRPYRWHRFYSFYVSDPETGRPVAITLEIWALTSSPDLELAYREFCVILFFFEASVSSYMYCSDPCLRLLPSWNTIRETKRILGSIGFLLNAGWSYGVTSLLLSAYGGDLPRILAIAICVAAAALCGLAGIFVVNMAVTHLLMGDYVRCLATTKRRTPP